MIGDEEVCHHCKGSGIYGPTTCSCCSGRGTTNRLDRSVYAKEQESFKSHAPSERSIRDNIEFFAGMTYDEYTEDDIEEG